MMRFMKNAYLALVYLFLYIPVLVLVVFSFNSSKYAIGWKGFSLKWYAELLASSQLLETTAVAFNNCIEHFALISEEITLIKYFSIGTIFIAVIFPLSLISFNE